MPPKLRRNIALRVDEGAVRGETPTYPRMLFIKLSSITRQCVGVAVSVIQKCSKNKSPL
ncbi:MAG TPA: hypothetical protein VHX65_00045 [Pirellulales bacterium]|nr:hypothetical protein [Pirellulales bacterium]